MKIGILETGEVHPDLKARHGDYPAMFEALLGAADPTLEFAVVRVVAGEMPASPAPGRRLARHRLAPRRLRRPALDRAAQGVPARLRRRPGAGGRHLLRPPDPRRGAGRPGGEVGQGLGRSGCRTTSSSPAPAGWTACPTASRSARCTRTRWSTLPPGATVLARSPHCAYAALAYGDPEAPDADRRCSRTRSSARSSWTSCSRSAPAPPFRPRRRRRRARSLARPVESAAWARLIVAYLRRAAATARRRLSLRAAGPPPGWRARAPPAPPSRG